MSLITRAAAKNTTRSKSDLWRRFPTYSGGEVAARYVLYTTGDYLMHARTVNDLVVHSEERETLWQALRERSNQMQEYNADAQVDQVVDPQFWLYCWVFRSWIDIYKNGGIRILRGVYPDLGYERAQARSYPKSVSFHGNSQ